MSPFFSQWGRSKESGEKGREGVSTILTNVLQRRVLFVERYTGR